MKNQCDGCLRGLPVVNGIHQEPQGGMGQGCTSHLYVTETKMVAFTVMAHGVKRTMFLNVPRTANGSVTLSGDTFNRCVERALGFPLERGTTISVG